MENGKRKIVEMNNAFPGADFSYDAPDILFRPLTFRYIHNYDAKHLQMGVDFLSKNSAGFLFEDM